MRPRCLVTFGLLTGCLTVPEPEPEPEPFTPPPPDRPCLLVGATPSFATLNLADGDRSTLAEVALANDCEAPLAIEGAFIEGSNAFEVGELRRGTLARGETAMVPVVFEPHRRGTQEATLVVRTNDTLRPAQRIALRATAIDTQLTATPTRELDFGRVPLDCPETRSFVLRNRGEVPITLMATDLESAHPEVFEVTTDPPLPAELTTWDEETGEPELELLVTYSPDEQRGHGTLITLETDDSSGADPVFYARGSGIVARCD